MEDLIEQIGTEVLPSQAPQIYKTLGKVLGNIVKNPDELKFRTLKKDNKIVVDTLGKSKSAIELLLLVGFQDAGSIYQCPPSTDLTDMMSAAELIECIAESMQTGSVEEVPKSAAPAPTPAAAAGGYPKSVPKPSQPLGAPKGFSRNAGSEEEKKRIEQADQLAAIRATKAARTPDPVATAPPPQDTQAVQSQNVPTSQQAKPAKSAFDFESKSKKQEHQKAAEQSLDDLRELQKQKYKEFESDPNARKAPEYQRPASSANGEQKGWFDGWFGGGSSSSGKDDKKPPPGGGGARPGPPRMKTINDLPKPVQRGG